MIESGEQSVIPTKANHAMAYADAFAVATAMAHGATLLTGGPEILHGDPSWSTEDLRA